MIEQRLELKLPGREALARLEAAKIPEPLARHIARVFYPSECIHSQ